MRTRRARAADAADAADDADDASRASRAPRAPRAASKTPSRVGTGRRGRRTVARTDAARWWLTRVRARFLARACDRGAVVREATTTVSFARAVLVLAVACAATYLRNVLRFDAVVRASPGGEWLNQTVLARLPALEYGGFQNTNVNGPGARAKARGMAPKHPVVIVPGFVSTGLELWSGRACGKQFFRQRMWGTPAMARAFFANMRCWMEHMRLDPNTGLDPEGIKLRAVRGLEAVDWFAPGYFVWARHIEELGELGYDANNIHSASYDWRLSPLQLEKRDGYMTRLKSVIETFTEVHGEKSVILAHSYGDTVARYFFDWVETPVSKGGGGGGRRWVEKHVESYVDIAGPMLGVAKALPSLLSGEMRDTTMLGELEGLLGGLLDVAVGRVIASQLKEACETFRSWGSVWAMLPRGGAAVWGDNELGSPDDAPDDERLNYFLQIRAAGAPRQEGVNHTIDSALDFLFATMQEKNPHNVAEFSHVTHPKTQAQLLRNDPSLANKRATDFGNALTRPLPYAPNMKVFCLYGTGKASERAYVYEHHATDTLRPFQLDVQYHARGIQNGVRQVHGDGTITLASLGYVCRSVWRTSKKLNPAGVPVVTREYAHVAPQSVASFQGRAEGDHINIMGNEDMIEDILAIVAGQHDQVKDRVESELDALSAEIARRRALHKPRDVNAHPNGSATPESY